MNVKKLGFGMMRLPLLDQNDPVSFDFEQLNRMVDAYLEAGFNYFDTSFVYHNGQSETATRKALVERHPRDSYYLATKLPAFNIQKEEEVRTTLMQQLENCGVEHFDYYLLHNLNRILYSTTVQSCKMFEQAVQFKEEGLIKHLGFSFHDSAEVLDRILTDHPETEFVQIALNYYDWDSCWIQARKCYEVIHKHGKDVIVMEPVKGGMLSNVPEEIASEMKARHPELTPSAWAVKFTADLDGVLTVLSGMSTMDQVLDNISYMKEFTPLSADDKRYLLSAVPMFKQCGIYGLPDFSRYAGITPNGMPVAEVLDAYNSCTVQTGSYCENNYYKSIRYENGIEGSWISGPILDKDGKDITEIVREAETYLLENSY